MQSVWIYGSLRKRATTQTFTLNCAIECDAAMHAIRAFSHAGHWVWNTFAINFRVKLDSSDFWPRRLVITHLWRSDFNVFWFMPIIFSSCGSFFFSWSWPPYGIGQVIMFSSRGFFFFFLLSFFLAYSQQSEIGCLPYFHTCCVLSANFFSTWNHVWNEIKFCFSRYNNFLSFQTSEMKENYFSGKNNFISFQTWFYVLFFRLFPTGFYHSSE